MSFEIQQLTSLKSGWYYGEGAEFNSEQIQTFLNLFQSNFDSKNYLPTIYPMVDGTIQLEWTNTFFDVSLAVKLDHFTASFHSLNLENESFKENKLDLYQQSSWKFINDWISTYFKK